MNAAETDIANRLIESRDLEHIEKEKDETRRRRIISTLTTYRRPDRLAVGDPVPDLTLARLDGAQGVQLAAPRTRPLVLIFGSYT